MAIPVAVAVAVWGYRAYRIYKVAKAVKKASKVIKAAKKAKQIANKTKKGCKQGCKPSLESLRRRAVKEAWKREKELVARTGKGSRPWTKAERKELLETGKVKGYEGHHINSVKQHPNLAGEPRNIKFVKGRLEHLREHGGNYQNPTQGPMINR